MSTPAIPSNPLTERLAAGESVFGATLTIADPFVAEVMAAQPLDFLVVDTEHSPISPYQVQTQLIALRSSAAALLVRVAHNEPVAIMQMLDMGAEGVVVPQVESADDCRRAVAAAFYPPRGERGVGPRRAARLTERATYFEHAAERTFLGVMIESAGAVHELDAILAVEHLGGVIIGAADLAASLGHLGDPAHPEVVDAVDLIMDRCRDTGVPFGMYAASGAEAMDLLRREAQIVTVGSDLIFLERGLAQATETLRSVRGWKLDAIDETQEVGRA